MGIDVVDPLQSRKLDAKMHSTAGQNRFSKNKNNNNNKAPTVLNAEKGAPGLSADDARLIKWVKDQHSRRGGFVRIFPRAETWSVYGGLPELENTIENA